MKYRNLGKSGLKVSAVSLGSWLTFGNSVEAEAGQECLRAAIDGGVNFIDTADIYARGAAEEFLGDALQEYRRQNIVLATKAFWPMSDDPNDRGLSRKHLMESCHASLKRLKTDYLDLYQCHRFDPETPVDEVVRAMDDLIRQGKVLYWGVSCWDAEQIQAATDIAEELLAHRPISNQPPYNLLQREIEAEVIPASVERGLGQVVFSPLAQGLLTGKYRGGEVPADSRLANDKLNRFMKERATEENFAKIDALAGIAEELSVPLATLALAWCLREANVASVIMGATKPAQVRANLAAAELELDDEVLARIETALGAS